MDFPYIVIVAGILFLSLRMAYRGERLYQALKSNGAYEKRTSTFSRLVEFRRAYEDAREVFIREQKNNRQSAQ